MDAARRRALTQELAALETDYWYDVDHHWGADAHGFYSIGGVFMIGDQRMDGQETIREFYAWRRGRGDRVARHIVSNFHLSVGSTEQTATLECVMCLHAADGRPVLPSLPAIMIADVITTCTMDPGRGWLMTLHHLQPVFMGGEKPTVPPPG